MLDAPHWYGERHCPSLTDVSASQKCQVAQENWPELFSCRAAVVSQLLDHALSTRPFSQSHPTCFGRASSCTGFSVKDKYPGAGAVQLAALGAWLVRQGFKLWDLGMELDYKMDLGGRMVPRAEWARKVRQLRVEKVTLESPPGDEGCGTQLLATLRRGDEVTAAPAATVPEEKVAAGRKAQSLKPEPSFKQVAAESRGENKEATFPQ
eukprot:s1712_g5.t1